MAERWCSLERLGPAGNTGGACHIQQSLNTENQLCCLDIINQILLFAKFTGEMLVSLIHIAGNECLSTQSLFCV